MYFNEIIYFLNNSGYALTIPNNKDDLYNLKTDIDFLFYSAIALHYNIPYPCAIGLIDYISRYNYNYRSITELQENITYKYHFRYSKYMVSLFKHNNTYVWTISNISQITAIDMFIEHYIFAHAEAYNELHIVYNRDNKIQVFLKNTDIYKFVIESIYSYDFKECLLIHNNEIHSYDEPALCSISSYDSWYVYGEYIGKFDTKEEFIAKLKEKYPLYYTRMLKEQSQNMFD